jgi:hypothetical protein
MDKEISDLIFNQQETTGLFVFDSIVGDKITGPFQTFISFLFIRLLQLKKCQIKA